MNKTLIIMSLTTMMLFACGGSEDSVANGTLNSDFKAKLSNTSWEKGCSAYNKFPTDALKDGWNIKIKLNIDSSLKSTYRTEYFHPTDTACNSMLFDTLDISNLTITGTIISEESIVANGLNEAFIYNSESNVSEASYTLIYIDSEKLYFGQKSGSNLGKTPETRHSSISLDDYFTQISN